MPRLITPVVPAGRLAGLRPPVLDLGDCALRPWREADADAVVEAFADPAIQQWHARSMADRPRPDPRHQA